MRLASAAVCLALVASASRAPRAQSPADPVFDRLADLVTAKMREHHVPGVALGVLRDGHATIRAFGVSNV